VGLFLVNRVFWMNWGDTSAYIAILGIAIVFVVLFLPEGLSGLFRRSNRLRLSVLVQLAEKHRRGPTQ
jgi:branched-chain amino acid transport system permease protein